MVAPPAGPGLLLVFALFAAVAVPWPLSESCLASTQVAHYNRLGWALLTTLLLFGVPAGAGGQGTRHPLAWAAVESAAVAALLSLLFFLKATYFAVGLVFVLLFGVVLGHGGLGVGRHGLRGGGAGQAAAVAGHAAGRIHLDVLRRLGHPELQCTGRPICSAGPVCLDGGSLSSGLQASAAGHGWHVDIPAAGILPPVAGDSGVPPGRPLHLASTALQHPAE